MPIVQIGLFAYNRLTAHKPTRSEADVRFQIIWRLPFLLSLLYVRSIQDET